MCGPEFVAGSRWLSQMGKSEREQKGKRKGKRREKGEGKGRGGKKGKRNKAKQEKPEN